MNKHFFAVLFFLFGMHAPIEAITPKAVQEHSIANSLAILALPIVFDLLDGVLGFHPRNNRHYNKQFWPRYAAASIVGGALTYYVLNKYTPKSKYDWAISVMQKRDKILSYDKGSLERIGASYNYYHELARAVDNLDSACKDAPDDHLFKSKSEKLVNELKNLQRETESHAMVAAHRWFEDLTRHRVPKGNINAVEWAGKLIGKFPGIDYIWWG